MTSTQTALTIGAIFYPNFELLDMFGPLEMFGCVGSQANIVTVAQHAGPVKSAQHVKAVADFSFEDAPSLDVLVLPGGFGTVPELENEALLNFLRERAKTARVVLSVCTGSALLAKAGLLDGLRATTNKQYFALAVEEGPCTSWVEAARWVTDGADNKFVTASGVSAGMDAALAVIAQLFGADTAERVAATTEYTWHRDSTVDPFVQYLNHGDTPRLRAMMRRTKQ